MPRRPLHFSIAILLFACGVLLSATLQHDNGEDPNSLVAVTSLIDPTFHISSGRGQLLLAGVTSSTEHEAALLQLADDQFADVITLSDFHPGVSTPADWIATSNRLLYALAAAESAQASMQDKHIEIRAVTSDAATLLARLDFLREIVGPGTLINSDIVVVDSAASFEQLCTQAFSRLSIEPVSFKQSSAEIRTAAYVTLDRITEFASDCPHVTIAITGHTDATGNESWNRQLSMARAQAIADHLAQHGIDPQRLIVQGMGSSVPLADNSTLQGRELNRRIEFELR